MGRGLDWTPSSCTDQSNQTEDFYTSTRSMSFAVLTRSSAIAEGPRGASYQLKSCQSPRNSAETTCTSPEQIELMKLEGDNGPMCNKHVHSTMTRSSRFHRPIGVKNKPTTHRVVDITCVPTTLMWPNFPSPQSRNSSGDPDHAHLRNTHSSQD